MRSEGVRAEAQHLEWARRLVVALGFAVGLHALFVRTLGLLGDGMYPAVTVLFLLGTVASAWGLGHRARWSWVCAFVFAAVGLALAAPVTGTLLLGSTSEPIGSGTDVLFFPAVTAITVALLVALWRARGEVFQGGADGG